MGASWIAICRPKVQADSLVVHCSAERRDSCHAHWMFSASSAASMAAAASLLLSPTFCRAVVTTSAAVRWSLMLDAACCECTLLAFTRVDRRRYLLSSITPARGKSDAKNAQKTTHLCTRRPKILQPPYTRYTKCHSTVSVTRGATCDLTPPRMTMTSQIIDPHVTARV